jgi:YVTN family beta-propeller protein
VRSGERAGAPIRFAAPADDATFAIASVGHSVWVSSFASDTVTRIVSAVPATPSRAVVVSGGEEGAAVAFPRGARVVARIGVPPGQGGLAAGEGAVWAMTNADSVLARIDPRTNSVVARIHVETGADVVAGNGAVWVSYPGEDTVARIDPATNKVTTTIPVGRQPAGLALARGAVWVANIGGPSVSRIDTATNRVVATIRVGPQRACCSEHMSVTADDDAVWVAVPNFNTLVRIDPATNTITDTVKVPYPPCAFLVADAAAVWSAGGGCGDVLARVDARTKTLTTTVEGELHPIGLALAFGSLWVASLRSSSVDRLDPHTGRVVARLPVGVDPIRMTIGFGSVWVSDEVDRVLRIQPQR